MQDLASFIEDAFEHRADFSPRNAPIDVKEAVGQVLDQLDSGALRVAEKAGDEWRTHQWIKKAVLLSFRLHENDILQGGYTQYFDKVESKFAHFTARDFEAGGYRVVPPATARRGAFIAKDVVLMPSYVNTGAYVDEGTMVDTWATVGSCAQIGIDVHLSGGVGIGAAGIVTLSGFTELGSLVSVSTMCIEITSRTARMGIAQSRWGPTGSPAMACMTA